MKLFHVVGFFFLALIMGLMVGSFIFVLKDTFSEKPPSSSSPMARVLTPTIYVQDVKSAVISPIPLLQVDSILASEDTLLQKHLALYLTDIQNFDSTKISLDQESL